MNQHLNTYNLQEQWQENILHTDGYVDVSDLQPVFIYHLKDHLGNVRIVLQPGGYSGVAVVQSNDYFPFGMAYIKTSNRWGPYYDDKPYEILATAESPTFTKDNRYFYNGKEEQPMPGKWLDYGARFYDAQLGRWHSIDPLAEAFISFTPYHYVRNNPVKLYDINGMGDNDWFDKQQEIDANYNAQNDAMFNSIVTGPALGKTQTVKNTDEKKKKNKGENDKKKNASRPDNDGHLTYGEADGWWKWGEGQPLYVDIENIDFGDISMDRFNNPEFFIDGKPGVYVKFETSDFVNINQALVYGTIGIVKIGENTIMAMPDTYNFDLKMQKGTFVRDAATLMGKHMAGIGKEFPIYFRGTTKLP